MASQINLIHITRTICKFYYTFQFRSGTFQPKNKNFAYYLKFFDGLISINENYFNLNFFPISEHSDYNILTLIKIQRSLQ